MRKISLLAKRFVGFRFEGREGCVDEWSGVFALFFSHGVLVVGCFNELQRFSWRF